MTTASSPRPFRRRLPWQAVIDCLVLFLWSFVLIRFAVTGKLFLLLHPDYMWLSHLAAVMLFGLGTMRAVQIWQSFFANPLSQPGFRSEEHIALIAEANQHRVITGHCHVRAHLLPAPLHQ